jgi:RHS repeat-associated protein
MARSNGVASAFTYDAAGRLLSVAHRDRSSAVLGSESLRYDAAGRRSSRVREDGATDFFRYDPAGQVTAAAYGLAASADPVAFPASQTFAYDPAGNRTQAVDGPLTASYQANAVNQYSRILVGAAETLPSFDALGNLLEDDRAAYAWDADIHLLSVAPKDGSVSAAYRYDALHRRVARLEGSATLTYFVHDGWNVVAEYSGSPGSAALAHEVRHVWGEDLGGGLQAAGGVGGLLASVRASGANWTHYDGNGNVVLLTDGAGTASARYAYDAFGKLKSSSGPAAEANRYRFSTKPQERAAGLSYYGYRYYAPSHGRWLSRDPLGTKDGPNLYQLLGNNPTCSADYLGMAKIGDKRITNYEVVVLAYRLGKPGEFEKGKAAILNFDKAVGTVESIASATKSLATATIPIKIALGIEGTNYAVGELSRGRGDFTELALDNYRKIADSKGPFNVFTKIETETYTQNQLLGFIPLGAEWVDDKSAYTQITGPLADGYPSVNEALEAGIKALEEEKEKMRESGIKYRGKCSK